MNEGERLKEYIEGVRRAVSGNRQEFFPMDRETRKRKNLSLARNFGYGFADFPNWEREAGGTYGKIIVANSFDSIGVAIGNKEWIENIKVGVQRSLDYRANQNRKEQS